MTTIKICSVPFIRSARAVNSANYKAELCSWQRESKVAVVYQNGNLVAQNEKKYQTSSLLPAAWDVSAITGASEEPGSSEPWKEEKEPEDCTSVCNWQYV